MNIPGIILTIVLYLFIGLIIGSLIYELSDSLSCKKKFRKIMTTALSIIWPISILIVIMVLPFFGIYSLHKWINED